ncbi:hypothetical protein [Salipiger abyssi]|uniref:hypothetical protein n=1 Tax=Salipiger abyssi TaxID=1250539 RepID=UPI0009784698|nr:hypothetical protein [Salipiger abyssi]
MRLAGSAIVVTLALLAACKAQQTTAPDNETTGLSDEAIVFSIRQVPEGDSCRTVFPVTYPADIPPHQRVFPFDDVESSWARDFPLTLPLPPDHLHDIVRNSDGTISSIAGTTAHGCAARRWVFDPGRCLSGSCPPALFVESDQMGNLTVRRAGR